MFFIPLLLSVTITSIGATFPELPDVNSFMPAILEMVPVNGQLRVNDQIFNFGSTTTPSTVDSSVDTTETPNNGPQSPDFESRTTDNLPPLPTVVTQTQSQNNGLITEQNSDSRAQNDLSPMPPTIADSFPQSFPIDSNSPNFETRIPSLDSILSNLRTQNSFANTLPNMGSTEMGSTFARNTNSDFRDEFSQQSASTPFPFGFPSEGTGNEVRPNLGSTESPLVVMPLVVSPDRLLQRNGMSGNPLPIPALFSSANDNQRMSASERVESLPVEVDSNGSAIDSTKLLSRQSTIVVSPTTFRELTNESVPEERNLDAELDRHVMKILRNSNATRRAGETSFFISDSTKSEGKPVLTDLGDSEKQNSETTPESTQKPKTS